MQPELIALAGAVATIAGIFYRHLLKQLADEKAECRFWREYALRELGLTAIAAEEAAKTAAKPTRRIP